jgi:ABC-2 type transport system permease protein
MISLLAAVFFSGFFLPISGLRLPVQYLAYALPVYYGREAFQRLFLVGAWPNPQHLLALLGLAVFFFALNSVLFARDYRKQ